jgi:hypothetical protein
MTTLHGYTSEVGFSVLVPDTWGYNENVEKIDLTEKERERQENWLNIGNDLEPGEKNARIMIEVSKVLSTALQAVKLIERNTFYNTFMQECSKQPDHIVFRDKTNVAQLKFLLIPHENVLKEREEITATRLLITLQRMTDKQRLQAKEDLGLQMGYFIVADDSNELDYPAMTIFKFSMKAGRTASELYKIYKQSLPVWFWSGIPDKGKTVRNKTVDRKEIILIENYLTYAGPDSLDAYATKGTTGWVINCMAHNFHKYEKLFSKMIESFCVVPS